MVYYSSNCINLKFYQPRAPKNIFQKYCGDHGHTLKTVCYTVDHGHPTDIPRALGAHWPTMGGIPICNVADTIFRFTVGSKRLKDKWAHSQCYAY